MVKNTKYLSKNPISKAKTKRKKVNGEYISEEFYIIDFLDIDRNCYVVSSFGRVFSLKDNKELPIIYNTSHNNYATVRLYNRLGFSEKYPLHILIAMAFIPQSSTDIKLNRMFVHNKNWDNEDNHIYNIEWRSMSEIKIMERVYKYNLTQKQLEELAIRLLKIDTPISDIVDILDYKLSKNTISKLKKQCK